MSKIDLDLLKKGDRQTLAKAITLVESNLDRHRQLIQPDLESLLPYSGNSIRIGISGAPGVGKSTFIEAFGLYLVNQGRKIAVLAVDPSSPVSGGSILGDKTRMEELSRSESAFIRPSPTGGALGGVTQKSRETLLLCEAAGYDVILIETVGVGQSEFDVAGMVDFFAVIMLPHAGDSLQGIKKGIIELADALIVNKADGKYKEAADETRQQFVSALHLLHKKSFWTPPVITCSARDNIGIDSVWKMISEYHRCALENKAFYEKRQRQQSAWLRTLIIEQMESRLKQNEAVDQQLSIFEKQVENGEISPYAAANKIIDLL